MLLKKNSTYIGLDLSINGSGITVISNDPKLKALPGSVKLSKSKFSLISGEYIKGERKEKTTVYTQKIWTPEGLASSDKLEGKPLYLRAHTIFHEFIEPKLKYNPTLIVIEGYAFGSTKGLIFDIAEFGGQIKYLLEMHYLAKGSRAPIQIVPPTNLKLYITGKGASTDSKQMMLDSVTKKYGIDFINDNICDSFSLAIMAAELGKDIEEFTKKGSFEELKEFKRKVHLVS